MHGPTGWRWSVQDLPNHTVPLISVLAYFADITLSLLLLLTFAHLWNLPHNDRSTPITVPIELLSFHTWPSSVTYDLNTTSAARLWRRDGTQLVTARQRLRVLQVCSSPQPNSWIPTHQITDRTLAINQYRLARRTSPLLLFFYYYYYTQYFCNTLQWSESLFPRPSTHFCFSNHTAWHGW